MLRYASFATKHEDLIHDISYDYYGKRIVTASSDQKLKVWDFNDDSGNWELNDSWKAHEGSILKVSWAHPEYGQVIASCSFDRSVRIWEEQDHEPKGSGKRWIERARLVDSRESIQDIEFAPNHLGFKLATCSTDGMVRIYEAMDVVNLAHWTLMEEFEVTQTTKETGNFCLSWCPSRFHPPMLVIGCGGRDSNARDATVKENTAKIFRVDQHNKWQPFEILEGHTDAVHDVSWAPNVGKTYQLIATASKDKHVRIYKITEDFHSNTASGPGSATVQRDGSSKRYKVDLIGSYPDHDAEVWRVEWNITGTVLSSSGDDGKVRLWKANYDDEWKCMSIISVESGDSMSGFGGSAPGMGATTPNIGFGEGMMTGAGIGMGMGRLQ
ncbi:WD40-repeat-containing domain protein [Paraphysoderma sedebokerense]|nr:WD40-repeat-containing domain protein [Paraphysoderma sedebokerense]